MRWQHLLSFFSSAGDHVHAVIVFLLDHYFCDRARFYFRTSHREIGKNVEIIANMGNHVHALMDRIKIFLHGERIMLVSRALVHQCPLFCCFLLLALWMLQMQQNFDVSVHRELANNSKLYSRWFSTWSKYLCQTKNIESIVEDWSWIVLWNNESEKWLSQSVRYI